MRSWLSSFLNRKKRPGTAMDLQAKLFPTKGRQIFGEAEFELYDDNNWELEAEVDFRGNQRAAPLTFWLNDRQVMTLRPDEFEAEGKISSYRGDTLSVFPRAGMVIDIKQDAVTVLSGTFK